MEDNIFGKEHYIFSGLAITFMLLSLFLLHFSSSIPQEFVLLAIIFALIGLLLVGMTVAAFSTRISQSVAKHLRMEERFRTVTLEELRREDDVLLAGIGPFQATLLFIVNLFRDIKGIQIINALVILSVVVFYLIRASAKLKDNNRLRFSSIVILGTLAVIDLVIIMQVFSFDFQILYFSSIALIFLVSLIFASLKSRYSRPQDKRAPEYLI